MTPEGYQNYIDALNAEIVEQRLQGWRDSLRPTPGACAPVNGVIRWDVPKERADESVVTEIQIQGYRRTYYPVSEVELTIHATFNEEVWNQAKERLGELARRNEWERTMSLFASDVIPRNSFRTMTTEEERRCMRGGTYGNPFPPIPNHPINDTSCYYYSSNPYLHCAVNDKCENCPSYTPIRPELH